MLYACYPHAIRMLYACYTQYAILLSTHLALLFAKVSIPHKDATHTHAMFLPAHLAIIFAKVQRTRRGSSEFSVEATEAPASARKVFVSNFVSLVSFPCNRSWLSSQGTTTHLGRLERCSASCVSLRLLIGTDRCVFCAGVRQVYSPIRPTVARRVNALWPAGLQTDPRRRFSRS